MHIIIHRGAKEIGGTCVELESGKSRILIDFGIPLVTSAQERFDAKSLQGKTINDLKESGVLPNVKGLYKNEKRSVDAILLSHSHLDHYGLLGYVHPDIPVYLSEGARILIDVSSKFTASKVSLPKISIVNNLKKTTIGDFKFTPYLVDHSAFDALAFLIEGGGKRVFYSGDFRGHGRKSALFQKIIKKPPVHIDCLLMEGSMIGRGSQDFKSELDVEKRITETIKKHEKITFIIMSSQNIDRIVSAYKACLRTDSIFVIDLYTAYILDQLKAISTHIPQFNWKNIRIKFYKQQADIIANKVSVKQLYYYNSRKIELPEINKNANRVLMLARQNSIFPRIISGISNVSGAKVLYSMWDGYLTPEFKKYCAENGLIIEKVHTSGHATVGNLQSFARALKAGVLIPIHTFHAKDYVNLFNNVKILKDGEAFSF